MNIKDRQKLKKLIRELSSLRGRHTELVTVYVPAGYDLNKIIGHLQQEQGTASNIKDARTRNNVIDSLERMIRTLRLYKKTPENGLAIFAGNSSKNESRIDIQVWVYEPLVPLKTRIYRCDQTFVVDLLQEMLGAREEYGLITMDRREATIGLLRGTNISVLQHMTSGVPGKTRAGGQSSQRFHRIREGAAKEFYKRISEMVNKEFLSKKDLKGIIIGGPGPTKEDFSEYLNNEIKKKVIAIQDITYTDESGLHHLVEKSQEVLAKESIIEEKKIMQKFFEYLGKSIEKVAYGLDEVKKALDLGAIEILLISEDMDDELIDELEEKCSEFGTELRIISNETREGKQLKDLSGVAAILRYAIS